MSKRFLAVLIVIGLLSATNAFAREGLYFGADIGAAIPQKLNSSHRDTDVPTNCDQLLTSWLSLKDDKCKRGQDKWTNSFDLGTGILAGVNLGYSLRKLRVEAEYFHRGQSGEISKIDTITVGNKNAEFVNADGRISDLRGNHFFANLYYDFQNLSSTRMIPYVGAGVGFTYVKMDFSERFIRSSDRGYIEEIGRNPNAAGTATLADHELSDTLFGYQLMAGFDYALSEWFYVGVKSRYGDYFGDFKDGNAWDQLRSHESRFEESGDIVRYRLKTNDLRFWGVSLNLKYFFEI